MAIEICRTVSEFRAACDGVRSSGRKLGLVPTMGALHEGHLTLVHEALKRADVAAVTIFVNPTQFGPNEDFERYPRTLDTDVAKCEAAGARLVFAPSVTEMYPPGERTRVHVSALTEHLCGATRPGHFEGVTTIVSKLFNVAGPCTAVFGRKDYQQFKAIQRMTRDLLMPIDVIGVSTVREPDGLALSSRNVYLSADERRRSLAIARGLSAAVRLFDRGERRAGTLRETVQSALLEAGFRIDYVEVTDADELVPLSADARLEERALLAVAAFMGSTRLIDNVVLGEEPAPIAAQHAS